MALILLEIFISFARSVEWINLFNALPTSAVCQETFEFDRGLPLSWVDFQGAEVIRRETFIIVLSFLLIVIFSQNHLTDKKVFTAYLAYL